MLFQDCFVPDIDMWINKLINNCLRLICFIVLFLDEKNQKSRLYKDG